MREGFKVETVLMVDIDFKPRDLEEYGYQIADRLMFFTKLYEFQQGRAGYIKK